MKTFQYLAGAASIVLAYYALKDRGFFNDASKPVENAVPDTDPNPNDYWFDHNRWGIF
ncbi:MAG: hypothetical protein JAY74_13455 [Candidatus Thiodiazotropha taylori]|nr:hypothetical protein [Candidatus Thiodiazotropha taylori]